MNMFLCVLMAVTAVCDSPEKKDLKKSSNQSFMPLSCVETRLHRIQEKFYLARADEDAWKGFLPVLDDLVTLQDKLDSSQVLPVQSFVVTNFTLYAFANETESEFRKANFDGRMKSLALIAKFKAVRLDDSVLFRIADWLGSSKMLPVEDSAWIKDIISAHQEDRARLFGTNSPPRFPGSISSAKRYWGASARACVDKYQFRKLYNERLGKFRMYAMTLFYNVIKNEVSRHGNCNKTWQEFCRRAKASAEEKAAAEKAIPAIVESKKEPESPGDIEVNVDF